MWLYQNQVINSIEDFPKNTFGFIYKVNHTPSGKSYVGKKSLYHNIKKKLTKKELAEQSGPGRKSVTRVFSLIKLRLQNSQLNAGLVSSIFFISADIFFCY